MNAVLINRDISAGSKVLWMFLQESPEKTLSHKYLADTLNVSVTSVKKYVEELQSHDLLISERTNTTHAYTYTPKLAQ